MSWPNWPRRKENNMDKRTQYEGFGRYHTADEWAQMLDMSVELFQYCTEDKDLTVEELYQIKGIEYKELKRGRYIEKARALFEFIFMQSGFLNIDELELQSKPGSPAYNVMYEGELVGKYYYKEARFVLAGEGFMLNKLDPETVKIQRDGDVWQWHPDTRGSWLRQMFK
jgi:cupin superfamily acireductone dioxygenase involved in methionine salvage